MPDFWYTNRLEVKGEESEVTRFLESFKVGDSDSKFNTPFSFKGLIPIKREEDSSIYWGAASDLVLKKSVINRSAIVIDFTTLWNPPSNWVKEVCNQFPSLNVTLKFYESNIAGIIKSDRLGEVCEEIYYDWPDIANFLYEDADGFGLEMLCKLCGKQEVSYKHVLAHRDCICISCQYGLPF